MEIKTYLNEQRELVEQALVGLMLSAAGPFARHIEAMRYSLFSGGKRLRPILCLAAAGAVSGSEDSRRAALPVACALECIHTYSLIHDDLPAMDDDDLRRGKATNHTVYGEAAAILAGDGLLTYAFDLLSSASTSALSDHVRIRIIQIVARAAGSQGMVGGQALDMIYEGKEAGYEVLHTIHQSKTGALITASIEAGALAAAADEVQVTALRSYGEQVGLAFQIIDDLLDLESTIEELGKAVGKDVGARKLTFPALFGVETSRVMAQDAIVAALEALQDFDAKADPLRLLARYIVERKK
ncbi:MAG: polyprenyl synthetase family protein [Desulfobulbaceae bacterium]|nr:polyprenyl synthetase family protein [Desulfobulbaceae bacterium]